AMAPKKNPLNLNALQLKTLTILQELARSPHHAMPATEESGGGGGGVVVTNLPHPHGDHFHVGPEAVALTKDASGLTNPAVWSAATAESVSISVACAVPLA